MLLHSLLYSFHEKDMEAPTRTSSIGLLNLMRVRLLHYPSLIWSWYAHDMILIWLWYHYDMIMYIGTIDVHIQCIHYSLSGPCTFCRYSYMYDLFCLLESICYNYCSSIDVVVNCSYWVLLTSDKYHSNRKEM